MGYQSRRRKYTSSREKLAASKRIVRLLLYFGGIALAGWLFFNRIMVWDWLRMQFY